MKVLGMLGWAVAVVAVAAALYLYGINRALNTSLEFSTKEQEQILERVEQQIERNRILAETVAHLSKELHETQELVSAIAEELERP